MISKYNRHQKCPASEKSTNYPPTFQSNCFFLNNHLHLPHTQTPQKHSHEFPFFFMTFQRNCLFSHHLDLPQSHHTSGHINFTSKFVTCKHATYAFSSFPCKVQVQCTQSFFSKDQFVAECLIYSQGKYISYLCFLQNHDLLQNHHPEQDPYLPDLCKRNIPFHYATSTYMKHSAEVLNQDNIVSVIITTSQIQQYGSTFLVKLSRS